MENERTPLLQPKPVPPLLPLYHQHRDRRHPSTSTSTRQSTRQSTRHEAPSLTQLARMAAAIKTGHLPSTPQFLQLSKSALDSSFLFAEHPPQGTIFEPKYGQGRLAVGKLTREGERVRIAMRELIESWSSFVENRNPKFETTRNGTLVGRGSTIGGGDGWQEFYWRCRTNEIDVDLPSIRGSSRDRDRVLPTVSSTLISLVTLLFTSNEFRQLVIDLIVLLRDATQIVISSSDRIGPGLKEKVEIVVDVASQEMVGKVAIDEEMKKENEKKVGRESDTTIETEEDPPLVDEAEPVLPEQTPEEIRDTFIDRFRDILSRLQETPQYQESVRNLVQVVRDFVHDSLEDLTPSVSIHPTSADAPKGRRQHLTKTPTELLIPLLEPFTGGPSSLSPLRDAYYSTISHLSTSNDDSTPSTLRQLGIELDTFLSKALLESNYLGSSNCHRTLSSLHDSFQSIGTDYPEFNRDLQSFLKIVLESLEKVTKDPYLNRTMSAMKDFAVAVERWTIAMGNVTMRAASGEGVGALWGDVVEWLAPRIMGVINEIPLPRIEFSSPTISGAIEAPSLLSTSFVPTSINIRNSSSITYIPTLGTSSIDLPISESTPPRQNLVESSILDRTTYATKTSILIEGIRLEVKDVGYFVQVHTRFPCFPHITESGLIDLHFGQVEDKEEEAKEGGGGISITLDSTSSPSQSQRDHSLFEMLPSSTVTLTRFDVKPHETNHPWIMFFLRPLLRTAVRKAVEIELRNVVMDRGDRVGEWLWRVKEKKTKAEEEEYKRVKGSRKREVDTQYERILRWGKAIWETVTEQTISPSKKKSNGEEEEGEEEEEQTSTELHLNRKGLVVDLPHPVDDSAPTATLGIGGEGVVIPVGEASIPDPPDAPERIGPLNKAKHEVDEAVEDGKRAARETWNVVGGIGEAREEYREDVEEERERNGWRSDAFDF